MRRALLSTLAFLACSQPPALVQDARKLELARSVQREMAASVEFEKSAVLAFTDEESEAFASKSAAASNNVDRSLAELSRLVGPSERASLEEFSTAWGKVKEADARILPLAVANTNLKAARVSFEGAAKALEAVLSRLEAVEAATTDPAELRRLAHVSRAALHIQATHMQHNVEQSDAGMSALEAEIAGWEAEVDAELARPRRRVAPPQALAEARDAWEKYKALTREVLRLSRLNTNVYSFVMSVRDKPPVSEAATVALERLLRDLSTSGTRPTR